MTLDNLDKKIIQYLAIGTRSYEQLARLCGVTRNTVYRRITALENNGVIKSTISCTVNFEQLDITPIIVGAEVPVIEMGKTINLFASHKNIKLLWRTYGEHNVVLLAFCQKGQEGRLIQNIRALFESANAVNIKVSTGFVWEKMELTPFDEETEFEIVMEELIEKRH